MWFIKTSLRIPKELPQKKSYFKIGPSFIANRDEQMIIMTRPINTFLFEIDQITTLIDHHEQTQNPAILDHFRNQILNDLVDAILQFFISRLKLMTGKKMQKLHWIQYNLFMREKKKRKEIRQP